MDAAFSQRRRGRSRVEAPFLHTSRDMAAAVKWQTPGCGFQPEDELKAGGESGIPGALLLRVLAVCQLASLAACQFDSFASLPAWQLGNTNCCSRLPQSVACTVRTQREDLT